MSTHPDNSRCRHGSTTMLCGRCEDEARITELESRFDLVAHLHRQAEFSARTFGPGARVEGVIDHIQKELKEVRDSGGALAEWVDVIILALDGAWRSGATPEQIVAAIEAKQTKNEGRTWPDWRTAPAGKAIEHDRAGEAAQPEDEAVDLRQEHEAAVDHAHEILRRLGYHRDEDFIVNVNRVGTEAMHVSTIATIVAAAHVVFRDKHWVAAPAPERAPLTAAARDVLTERERQISAEGWTHRHDDKHSDGSMALAAACYACNAATWNERARASIADSEYARLAEPGFRWPWALKWWKPKSQRQDLVRAAALILAELERIDRAQGTAATDLNIAFFSGDANPLQVGPSDRRFFAIEMAEPAKPCYYLSGPMSGIAEHNFPAFNAEAARLRALGYRVVNPVDINPDPGTSWHECLKRDLIALLESCDAIAMLPGWEGSAGAHLEMHLAHRVGMPIVMAKDLQQPATAGTTADQPIGA